MAVWFTHSQHTLNLHHQQHKPTSSSSSSSSSSCSSPIFPKPTTCCCSCSSLLSTSSSSSSSSSSSCCCSILGKKKCGVFYMSKRMLNLSLLTLLLPSFPLSTSIVMAEEVGVAGELELQRYTDSVEGFTLLVPSSWIKVDKAGATVLFEEANKGTNNVGVVVSPVRLTNLGEFGTPQFVADKLIQAEKRKESTKEAEVIAFSERAGHGGLQVYEFEYKVDSTRGGMKRIFSAAFVASKKLYLLNIANSDKPESPLDANRRLILEQVLHSFDTA